jgi:glucose-1-phosphate thymidylyltransferase
MARGLGSRMRREGEAVLGAEQARAASAGAKAMIPFGRPFIDYVLSALADGGITQTTLVVGPEQGAMRDYLEGTSTGRRVAVDFAMQAEPRGTADAVLAARSAVGDATFLVLNADNYYPPDVVSALTSLGAPALIGFDAEVLITEGGIEPERVLRYALLDVDDEGCLRSIVEKPAADHPLALKSPRRVSMNIWSFGPRIFDACERVRPSARGELELADAVMIGIRDLGERLRVVPMRRGVFDLSHRADVARVGAQLAGIVARP